MPVSVVGPVVGISDAKKRCCTMEKGAFAKTGYWVLVAVPGMPSTRVSAERAMVSQLEQGSSWVLKTMVSASPFKPPHSAATDSQ